MRRLVDWTYPYQPYIIATNINSAAKRKKMSWVTTYGLLKTTRQYQSGTDISRMSTSHVHLCEVSEVFVGRQATRYVSYQLSTIFDEQQYRLNKLGSEHFPLASHSGCARVAKTENSTAYLGLVDAASEISMSVWEHRHVSIQNFPCSPCCAKHKHQMHTSSLPTIGYSKTV